MRVGFAGLLVLMTAGCGGAGDEAADSSAAAGPADTVPAATTSDTMTTSQAMMRDSAGREIGTLTVAESGGALTVSGTLRGISPGTHGIHFHIVGTCEPPFTSAGDHFNPTNKQHGTANPAGPHVGDLGNIEAGADSSANVQVSAAGGMLRGATGLLDADGASIIIHASADDNRTDPSGNSGARVICGRVGS